MGSWEGRTPLAWSSPFPPTTTIEISEDPARDLRLRLSGKDGKGNITLRIEDVHRKMFQQVPSLFNDLLEVATYVYSADQVIRRGADDVDSFGDGWRRDLHFVVPVRNPDFWNSPQVQEALCSTLRFLSDDQYQFDFVKLDQDHPFQDYLGFDDTQQMYRKPEQVVMFSGGLDSLAGAIDEVVNQKRRVLLVTHKATSKLNKRYQTLEQMLAEKADGNAPPRISVRVHKSKELNHEYTQRSRSFLYVSIGATIAKMLGLSSVRFYENGVISLNLPVCAQVVGSRATRTTHPRVMKGFQDIISLVAGEPFTVENPYIWKTKADVVKVITDAGCHDLIKHSMTCTHTWEMTNQHSHCGGCSQCIDRRFAVLAAKADQYDPVEHYKFDVFTQTQGVPLGDAGDVADRQALREWQQRARELLGEIEEAREAGDHARIDEIEEEMAFLTKAMEGGKGLGGRQRKAGDKRKNVRDAFRNAVDRAIKQIERYDRPLAEHLRASIKYGNEVVYRPDIPITWDVRPIVNS
jgi:7-cyano-7-deazaguanine synthase in queuosine biosynthesis